MRPLAGAPGPALPSAGPPPASVLSFAQELTAQLAAAAPGWLVAAYLHGSAALGGWVPGRSDVDMLFVMEDGEGSSRRSGTGTVAGDEDEADNGGAGTGSGAGTRTGSAEAVERLAGVLSGAGDACPGRELECSVVTRAQARRPAPPWPFALHVVAARHGRGRIVRPGRRAGGDPDLLMHYAVCRAAGWPVAGPAPGDLIGETSRRAILCYLAEELRWAVEHAPEAYCVLNACRALVYLGSGRIVAKTAGGQAALARGDVPAGLVERALSQQHGSQPHRPPAPDAAAFALATAGALRAAAV